MSKDGINLPAKKVVPASVIIAMAVMYLLLVVLLVITYDHNKDTKPTSAPKKAEYEQIIESRHSSSFSKYYDCRDSILCYDSTSGLWCDYVPHGGRRAELEERYCQ